MTIKEIVYLALGDVNVSSDDHRLPLRFVYKKIKATRAELIRQYYKNGEVAISGLSQALECVKMEQADSNECGELSITGLLKSCVPIPDPIETEQRALLTGIYTASGRTIEFSTMRALSEQTRRRFQKVDPDPIAFLRNKYLYVANYEDIECLDLMVDGYYYNPEEVAIFNSPKGCAAIYDLPFEVPEFLVRRIVRIVADELRLKLGIPIDSTNNSKDDIIQQVNAT